MKLKNLSDLSEAYSKVAAISVDQQKVVTENKADFILNTDVTQYLSENVNKPGQALGGGPGTGKGGMIEPLAKKTGPVGLKGNNFKEVDHKADPGSDAKVMKKEEEHDEPASENDYEDDAAKITTPVEKVKESAQENNKYNYKPKFTMSKPKFDQLYEEALKRVPFTEDADAEMADEGDMHHEEDMGVPGADDAAADAPEVDVGGDEVTITLPKDLAQKLHDLLMAKLGGGEDEVIGAEEPIGDMAAEAIVNEPTPKEEKGNNAALQGKNNKVGDLHAVKHAVEKGAAKEDPTPKDAAHFDSKLQNTKGGANKTGSGTVATPGKKMFE
jgi:hypothetical protein